MQLNGDLDKRQTVTCPRLSEDIASAILIVEDFSVFFRRDMGTGAEDIIFNAVLPRPEIVSDDLMTIGYVFFSFPALGYYLFGIFNAFENKFAYTCAMRPTSTVLMVSWSGIPLSW